MPVRLAGVRPPALRPGRSAVRRRQVEWRQRTLISFQVRTRDLRPRPSARRQLGVGNVQRQRALILPSSGRDHLFLFEIENEIASSRRGGPRPSFLFQVDSEMAGRAAAARGKA